jgi:hypothetical protein
MARYRLEGTVVDTDKATAHWDEDTFWDGHNHISVPTGSQWNHETLYRSVKGRYYLVSTSQWQGSKDSAEWVTNTQAAQWLLENNYEVKDFPEELKSEVEAISE